MILYMLCFPATILGGTIRFGMADGYVIPVIIAQIITLYLLYKLCFKILGK